MNKYKPVEKVDKIIHLLVVDDDLGMLNVTRNILERIGYNITYANSGKEAIVLMEEYNDVFDDIFDVVITDYYMPGMNGIELAMEAKKFSINAPIILYTGKIDILNEDHITEAGLAGIITKPCSIKEIDNLIEKVLIEKEKTYQWIDKFNNTSLFHECH
ncbi:MAG: response regulator [Deltaproteobacteria bacterium]|nr:response regulator [Deltaproteobacteria bacterium]